MAKRFPCALQISPPPVGKDMQEIKMIAWTHDMTKKATIKKLSKLFPKYAFTMIIWEIKGGEKIKIVLSN